MSDAKKEAFVAASILNESADIDPDVYSVLIDGSNESSEVIKKQIAAAVAKQHNVRGQTPEDLNKRKLAKWREIDNDVNDGKAILPRFRFSQGGGQEAQSEAGGRQDKDFERKQGQGFGLENVADEGAVGIDEASRTAAQARGAVIKVKKDTQLEISDLGPKYVTEKRGGIKEVKDSKGRKFVVMPNGKIYRNGKEITLKEFNKIAQFEEMDEFLIYDVIEAGDDTLIVNSNEGIVALVCDENHYQIVTL